MKVTRPYALVQQECPEAVQEMLHHRGLARGKTVDKSADPADLTWSVVWGVHADTLSAADLFNPNRPRAPEPNTPEEIERFLDQRLLRCGVSVGWDQRHGRYGGIHLVSRDGELVPAWLAVYIRDRYHPGLVEQAAERQRVASLSPEQREREASELLGQLRGPGFLVFRK